MNVAMRKNTVVVGGKTHYQFKPTDLQNIEQERQNHFYLGLDKNVYHEHYDKLYHQILTRRKRQKVT